MNKKKVYKTLIVLIVISLLGYLTYKVVSKVRQKETIANQIQSIPRFNFTDLNGSQFSNTNLKPNTPTVFLYFNTECDFCEHEALSIKDNIKKFKNIQLVFVSNEKIEAIQDFALNYKLSGLQNITFLHDATDSFSTQFGVSSVPHSFFYDNKQKLIEEHKGQLNAKGILKILNN